MKGRPIEIVGGGLAGLALGVALRRADVDVIVHEAGEYPRHRVCGEFIAGLEQTTIDRLDLQAALSGALQHTEVAWSIKDQSRQIQRLPSPALGISRYTLDARLARSLVEAGGQLLTRSRFTDRTPAPGRVFATGRRRAVQSRWIGLKVHVSGIPLARDLEMHLGEHCYVGLSRIENGEINVCGLFRRRAIHGQGTELLLQYLRAARLDGLADRLEHAADDASSFSAVAALDFDRRVHRGDWVSVGDAGAMIPPFTGNGMAMAFQSAEDALSPILSYVRGEIDWKEVCRVTNLARHHRFRVRLASASVLHPFLLRPIRQQWFVALGRARLLPFGPLYAALH